MDFELSEEQRDLRDLARKILEDHVTNERLKELESKDVPFDRTLWSELAKASLLGLALPDDQGGSGFGSFELMLLLQEIGRTVAPVPAYATLALGALPITLFGNESQKTRWLPGVASGEAILTAALTELASDDPLLPATRADRDGDGWRLSGSKTSVPAGPLAHCVLVPARCDDGRVGIFLVDPAAEGVTATPQKCSDRQPHAQLVLDGVRVSDDDVLGDLDRGSEILKAVVEHATVGICAIELGVAERTLEMTAQYTTDRRQFDRPIGSFQAVHQRAADAYINVEAIRLTTREAAWQLSEGLPASDAVAIAKYWAAEGGQWVAYACTHLHGGIGIDVDYPLHRYFIWSTYTEHTLGPAPAQLAQLGARIAEGSITA